MSGLRASALSQAPIDGLPRPHLSPVYLPRVGDCMILHMDSFLPSFTYLLIQQKCLSVYYVPTRLGIAVIVQ